MTRYRATLAYDGTRYYGYQRQAAGTPTVQGEVERALAQVLGTATTVIAAGRTDTGVHAVGQVIAFDAAWSHPDGDLLRAVNAHLPPDIALQSIHQHPGFHPRFDAASRVYRYTVLETPVRQPLLVHRTWQIPGSLDRERMQQAAALLVGEHDFAAFGKPPEGENTVREVFASGWEHAERTGGVLHLYRIEATAFLYHMVRRIVAMLVAVGRGNLSVAAFEAVFRSADLSQARHLAPPQGLVLEAVRYPGEDGEHTAVRAGMQHF